MPDSLRKGGGTGVLLKDFPPNFTFTNCIFQIVFFKLYFSNLFFSNCIFQTRFFKLYFHKLYFAKWCFFKGCWCWWRCARECNTGKYFANCIFSKGWWFWCAREGNKRFFPKNYFSNCILKNVFFQIVFFK